MSMIGPRLKLARSLEHINVLSEEIVVFMKDNPPTANAGKTPDGAYLARVSLLLQADLVSLLPMYSKHCEHR